MKERKKGQTTKAVEYTSSTHHVWYTASYNRERKNGEELGQMKRHMYKMGDARHRAQQQHERET
jgi:hypothetical protein